MNGTYLIPSPPFSGGEGEGVLAGITEHRCLPSPQPSPASGRGGNSRGAGGFVLFVLLSKCHSGRGLAPLPVARALLAPATFVLHRTRASDRILGKKRRQRGRGQCGRRAEAVTRR